MPISNKHLTPDSSTIEHIDHADGKLHVKFKSGGTYHYDAPESVYHEMRAAPSVGKFLHANVKGKFGHVKVAVVAGLLLLSGQAQAQTTPWELMQRQIEDQHQEYAQRDAEFIQAQDRGIQRQQLEVLREIQSLQANQVTRNPLSPGNPNQMLGE